MTISDLKFMPEFFDRYINLVGDNVELLEELAARKSIFQPHLSDLESRSSFSYLPGKWTPKDIIQHIIDNERVQSYRALAIARGDQNVFPGYDEGLYANNTNAANRSIKDLIEEFELVRQTTIKLFESITADQLHNEGVCFEVKVTPLALGFQIIGHAEHHMNVISERYFHNGSQFGL